MFEKYDSLPKQVEAVRFTDQNKDQVFNSLSGQYAPSFEGENPTLKVVTVHGEIAVVRLGDWIVKDSKLGTYYPVKHEVFIKQYVSPNQERSVSKTDT